MRNACADPEVWVGGDLGSDDGLLKVVYWVSPREAIGPLEHLYNELIPILVGAGPPDETVSIRGCNEQDEEMRESS